MKIKYLLSSLLAMAISFSVAAQRNPGEDYLTLGEVKLAKEYFMKTMRQTPADSYYYLGEIAFREGNMEEAKSNYEKAIAGNPESPYGHIGLAKLELKSNTKAAEDQLSSIQKQNKKDIYVVLAIARAYHQNGMKEKATAKMDDARKINKKSPYIYLMEGDFLESEGKTGDAAMQYDQAINFDANCVIAYVKAAKVYEFINPTSATDMLKKVIALQPDYMLAYKYLGKIYSSTATQTFNPTAAVSVYKTLFAKGQYTLDDIRYYAGDEYYLKNYEQVKKLVTEGLAIDPDHFILNRLLMYSSNETKDFDAALAAAEKYFSLPRAADVNYIPQDHMAYGNILSEKGQKTQAIEEYKKAIALDPTKIELNKEIASICTNEGMDAEAAEFYKKYMELAGGDNIDATDYFQLGRYYYYGGASAAKDSSKLDQSKILLKEADNAFATVTERFPDRYLGHFWRARANALLDPETTEGLAKPHYEATEKVILAKGDGENKSELIEAYRYLSYYYYLQFAEKKATDAKQNTKIYSEKLLELDPTNSTGQQLLDAVK